MSIEQYRATLIAMDVYELACAMSDTKCEMRALEADKKWARHNDINEYKFILEKLRDLRKLRKVQIEEMASRQMMLW